MAYRDPYGRANETSNSIREQQEPNLNLYRPSNTYVPTQPRLDPTPSRYQPEHSQRRSYQVQPGRKNEIKSRIKEIIELCRGENSAVHAEMAGVIHEEEGVAELLARTDQDAFRPPQQQPQDAYRPQSHPQYTPGREDHGGLQQNIRSVILQNSHIQLPEEAHQLINQIERRALAQIEKVKAELAQERHKNAELERELAHYRSQGAPGGYENELRSKVAYLEGLLEQQRTSGSAGIDFNALYAQGEAIRQDTLRLLRLKEARVGGSNDEEKRRLREEVDRLQRRVEQLQHQRGRPSKPSYSVINEEYSPIAPAYKRSNSNRNSANEYQSLVMEMRKINAN